ncbi:MAG TPA: FAD-dependent monooxygenase [Ktedonobacteraceae bacterium]|nr:FAD-dependent monooxygenase [Ktedonobacteraceae bacterium]
MSLTDTNTNVLVVGAGPVGLALANELVRHGIDCRLIDSAPHATQKTKAVGVMPRTQELFAKMGVVQQAIELGLKAAIFCPYSDGKRLTRIDFREHLLDSPYPYVLMLPQHQTEQVLTEHLQSQGGAIEWQTELINVAQDEQGVQAQIRHADGREEHVQAHYLVGCDGAHSTVRHLLGLNFAGSSFEQSFAVGNVHLDWELPYDEIFAFVHGGSFIAYFPMVNRRCRVVIAYELDKAPPGDVTLEEIQHMIDVCGPVGARASDPADLTRFHVNQRKAEHYARGRIFLAGDAAHIHSPIGAQGMNTGIQDAFNLAWKLALVVKEQASPRLLESYEAEREEVGEALLRGTGRATRIVLTHNPLLVALRNALAPLFFSSLPGTLQRLAQALSEISIAYPHSPIVRDVRDKKGAMQAGDRAPDGQVRTSEGSEPFSIFEILKSPRLILLVFTGQQETTAVDQQWREIDALLTEDYEQTIEAYLITKQGVAGSEQGASRILQDLTGELHQRYETEQGGLLLIRPDGYIGFWGPFGATQVLQAYVQELFVSPQS